MQWKSIHSRKDISSLSARLNPKTARSAGLHPLSDRVPYYQYISIIAGHKVTGMDLIMASSTCEKLFFFFFFFFFQHSGKSVDEVLAF